MRSQTMVAEKAKPPPSKFSSSFPTIIRSIAELEPLKVEWQALTSPEVAPFQTFDWNLAWYRNFADCYEEILIFVGKKGTAIIPLYRNGNSLRLAGDNTCDYQDVIAANLDDARESFQGLLS